MTASSLDMTRDLSELVRLAAAPEEAAIDDILRRGLDGLARVARYDLATVFVLDGARLVVRAARGPLASETVREHALVLANFPSLREALETRRARAYTEDDHAHGDGDPFDGVLDLPAGHSCMVAPLFAGDRSFGILALDRRQCEPYPPEVVGVVEAYAQVLALAIHNAEQKTALARLHRQEHEHAKLLEHQLGGEAVGILETSRNRAMREVAARARQVAQTDTPVLILGETGTGKERLARVIHAWSRRAERSFVTLNCAAIPDGLLESELFGHVKGAFTGAGRDRPGRFQMANGGTLLLDEIGELPPGLQAKLLRVLQEGSFEPVGSDLTVKVDVRILAATHVDLEKAIAERRFREDLFYRLSVFPLRLPPLRERLEDLEPLVDALLAEQARRTGRRGVLVTAPGLGRLLAHAWPGNLRELGNVLERATILSPGRELGPEVLDLPAPASAPFPPPRAAVPAERGGPGADRQPGARSVPTLDDVQRRHIQRVLGITRGRLYGPAGAAALLGLKPTTLQSRMKKLGLSRFDVSYEGSPPSGFTRE